MNIRYRRGDPAFLEEVRSSLEEFIAELRERDQKWLDAYKNAVDGEDDSLSRAIAGGAVLVRARKELGHGFVRWRRKLDIPPHKQREHMALARFATEHPDLADEWWSLGIKRLTAIARLSEEGLARLRESPAWLTLPPAQLSRMVREAPAAPVVRPGQKAHGFRTRLRVWKTHTEEYRAYLEASGERVPKELQNEIHELATLLRKIALGKHV